MNIEKYTQKAQEAIIDCQNIAIEEGHQQVDGEHLHMALLQQKDGLIPKLLAYAKVNVGEIIGSVQNELDKLNKALEPLEAKRQEIAKAIQESQKVTDDRYLCAPEGKDVSKEELTDRVEKTFKAAGFVMEEGDALSLLPALALSFPATAGHVSISFS